MKKDVTNAYSAWKYGVYFFSYWAKCTKIDLTVGYVKRSSITLFCILLCHIFDQQLARLLGSFSQLAFLYFIFNCHYPTKALETFTKDTCANCWCLCQHGSLVLQGVAGLDHAGWCTSAQTFFTFLSRKRALSNAKVCCQWWISCASIWPGALNQTMFMKHWVLLHFICHSKFLEN